MFQLSLLGTTPQGQAAGGVPGEAATDTGLMALFRAADGELAGFSGELQSLLMQLTPQMLQRLDNLHVGGTNLPQAANEFLTELDRGNTDLAFARLLQRVAGAELPANAMGSAGLISVAETTPATPLAGLPAVLTESAELFVPPPLAGPGALVAGAQPTLSQQLTGPLLDMGVPQQVGAKDWSQAIADRVMWMVHGDQQFARLKLNPPQLGPLEVRVNVQQDQTSVTFLASHAATREALEAAMPRLRELFDQAALQLVRADVNDPGNEAKQQSGMPSHAGHHGDEQAGDDPGSAMEMPPGVEPMSASDSLVDLFA